MKKVFFFFVFLLLGNAISGLAESPFDEEVEKRIEDSDVQYMFSKYAKTENADAMRLYKEGTYLINIVSAPSHYKERIQEGVSRLQKALELDPNFSGVHLSLGQAYIFKSGVSGELKNQEILLKKAKAEFKKAVELDPKNADTHRRIADLSDDMNEKIYHFKVALELDPEQDISELSKARIADSLGKVSEVFDHLARIRDIIRTPVPGRCSYVKSPPAEHKYYGLIYFQKKYPKEYKAFVERVCRGKGMPEYEPPCEECGD